MTKRRPISFANIERRAKLRASPTSRRNKLEGVYHGLITDIINETGASLSKSRRDHYAWLMVDAARRIRET